MYIDKITIEIIFDYQKIMPLLLFLKFIPVYNVLSAFGDLRKVNGLEFQHTCGHVRSKENFVVVVKLSVLSLRGSRYCYFDR